MSDTAKDQAIAQCASIAEMVAALDVDYDRLEELRDEIEQTESDIDGICTASAHGLEQETKLKEHLSEIKKELAELEEAAGDCTSEEEARKRIEEDALSVEVRSDWVSPGEDMTAGEFRILLCTGGPHVEIVGDLDNYKQPSRPRILYKDFGESGELFDFDREAVLRYCSVFYFGE